MKMQVLLRPQHAACAAVRAYVASRRGQGAGLRRGQGSALELFPQFEKTSGNKVAVTWAGTVDIKKKIAAGEVFDLVIVASPELDTFAKDGKIVAGSKVDLVRSSVGVAVKAGAPKPDLKSGDDLKKALLAAKSVGYSTGPSGVYLVRPVREDGHRRPRSRPRRR